MKLLKLLIPALALLLFLSCGKETPVDYVLFSGTIENPDGNKLTVHGQNFEQEIAVAEDGSFSDTVKIDVGYFSFTHAERSTLYLSPGMNLSLTLNTEEFDETIKYMGEGADINNYMAAKTLKGEEVIPDYKEFYMMDEADYVAKAEVLKSEQINLLSGLKVSAPKFYDLEQRNITYDHLFSLTNFEMAHGYYHNDENFKASDNLLIGLTGFDYDNGEDYLNFGGYRNLVDSKFIDYFAIQANPDTIVSVLSSIKELKSEKVKNGLMTTFKFYLSPSFEQLTTLYDGIMEISTDKEYKAEITEKYDVVKKLQKGQPAPKFTYNDNSGVPVTMDDLKGKVVYIDVWATWCGPCLREVPHLKEVEAAYEDKNVQFVSISIDRQKDFDKWKQMIIDKELGGLQLYAKGDWKSSLATDYAIDSIPRFLLIDADGNIVSADAPRPSNKKLREMLDGMVETS